MPRLASGASYVSGVPIRAAWGADYTGVPSLGYRYRLYSAPWWVSLPGSVMDWCNQYGLSWAVSITMDVGFGLDALDQALEVACPEIFNSAQGAQLTGLEFTERLVSAGIQISEEVDVKDYETPREAMQG